jgi:cytochrome c biogenesis protein CcdA
MSWRKITQELGHSLLELLRAEIGALTADLGSSVQRLLKVSGVFAVALFLLFWSIGILAYLAIELLKGALPVWGAILAVFLVFLLAAIILGLIGRAKLRRLESPAATLSHRIDDHRNWWEEKIMERTPTMQSADDRDQVGGDGA